MRKTAELPNLVLAAIGAGTWDWDMRTNIIGHSKVFSDIIGITDGLDDHPYPLTHHLIHPDDAAAVLGRFLAAVQAGAAYSSTHRLCRPDGTIVWVEDMGRVIEFDTMGQPKRMVGALRDVTESVLTSQKLTETEANFSDLVESVPGAIVRCSVAGRARPPGGAAGRGAPTFR